MSTEEPVEVERLDAPNQQAVRADGSGPAEEGTGGGGGEAARAAAPTDEGLDALTKDELLAKAQELGVTPANAGMTKDELKAAIEAAGA